MKKVFYMATALAFMIAMVQVPAIQAESESNLKKIPLRYSNHIPKMVGGNIFLHQVYMPRVQEQLAKVGYTLDVTFYHSGSLYKYSDQVQACDQGLVDMTSIVLSYELARAPLHEVLDMPFMGWDPRSAYLAWAELDESIPEFQAELSGFKELYRFISVPRLVHHNLKQGRVPADFKGTKIHTTGMTGDLFRSLGAVPIRQNPGDWYTSLDRGLFDGIAVGFDMVTILKLYEVLNNHVIPTNDGFGYTAVSQLMNRQVFDSLPAPVQKVLEENAMWATETLTQMEMDKIPMYEAGPRKKGNNFLMLTPEETALWREAVKPIHEEWIEKMEAKGLPGRKVFEESMRLSHKYKD